MMIAPAVKLFTSAGRIRGFDKGDTYAKSEMIMAHLRPNLSAMVPRIEAPKIAPIVVPAVIISLSVAERV